MADFIAKRFHPTQVGFLPASADFVKKSTSFEVLFSGGSTQVFAYGEDTHSLRLVSKLPDLRVGYVNWILLR